MFQAGSRGVHNCGSTNGQLSEESSAETDHMQDSLEENTMPDSGIPEGSSEVSTFSVS